MTNRGPIHDLLLKRARRHFDLFRRRKLMVDILDATNTHASFSLQRKALAAVANLRLPVKDPLSVVWFCKTLQNWKAVVTPLPPDGHIYEVTYDGDKKRTYVDTYVKKYNDTIPDMEVAIND